MATKNNPPQEVLDLENLPTEQKLEQDIIRNAAMQDPVMSFIYRHQKVFSYLVIAILVAILGYRYYKNSHQQNQAQSAEYLYGVQSAIEELAVVTDEKEKEVLRRKLAGNYQSLASVGAPYNRLRLNYEIIQAVNSGDIKLARTKLATIDWQAATVAKDTDAMIYELAALYTAKASLDYEEFKDQGKKELVQLANKSEYVAASAALTLKNIAVNESDIDEAKKITEQVLSRFPEQSDILKVEE
jgi:predicted negative regulator of RcsB-dependent stress response